MKINKIIFIISNESWGEIWFSKHHYANELSKLGYKVYFVNAPNHWNIRNMFNFKSKIDIIHKNLYLINYSNNFPVRVFPTFFIALNDILNRWKIKRKLNIEDSSIMWTFDPLRFAFFPLSKKIIYHIADPLMKSSSTKIYDDFLSQKANLIVCTSPKYNSYYKQKGIKNVITVQHKISHSERQINVEKVKIIKEKYDQFILLIGTLNEDIDYKLIESINKEIKINFLFIGKNNLNQPIEKRITLNNRFHNLGVLHSQELRNYIYSSTLCITAYKFKQQKGIVIRSPLKILNYLAQSKIIITSIDSEIPELLNCAIYKANSKEEFLKLIKKGLANNLIIDKKAISEYLNKNTYEQAISQILSHLNNEVETTS